ncbi:MAG: stringent starvation protein SspA [Gammaproteobacteria bacterium]|nr:stringent starvation protein SspA [Gammaproteobacteria bacterium]
MSVINNKRSVMTLFSNKSCPYSQRVRIVLAEKGVVAETVEVDLNNKPNELFELNPYGTVPTLVDRDLVLYESSIILEYLEERFPHPPLMPVYPVARARNRLMMLRVDRDWYSLVKDINHAETKAQAEKARKELYDSLLSVAPVFGDSPYFLSEEFTLVDCSLAALLWRLPSYGINLPAEQGKPIIKYAEKLFKRESFQTSLTDAEREMRD